MRQIREVKRRMLVCQKNEQSGGEILEAMACETLISEKFS